jgi:Zn-dependent protease
MNFGMRLEGITIFMMKSEILSVRHFIVGEIWRMKMDEEELAILFIILGILILVAILNGFVVNYEKTECLKEGGKWVSGMIAGNYSYFCVPK